MTITYKEFDTTPAALITALRTEILVNPHWAELPVTEYTTTSTGATTAATSTVTLSNVAGFAVGGSILAGVGTANEMSRVITAINGNILTVNATWGVIHASGATFKTRDTVLKSTAATGAQLIVNLEGGDSTNNYLGVSFHSSWTTTDPMGGGPATDRDQAYLYYKNTAGAATMPIHVTMSAGQDHLFVAIEGPRATEANTTSNTYGSVKNYFAISSIVNYHVTDTVKPAIAIGQHLTSATPSVTSNAHQVGVSKDSTDTQYWQPGRLGTLTFPTIYSSDVITMNRSCTIDGKNYLLPYVLFSESEGIRGRLSRFFYANTSNPSPLTDYPDPVGVRVEQDGIVYKILAVNKGDGSSTAWGPFGSVSNGSSAPLRSVLVAVPYADAV